MNPNYSLLFMIFIFGLSIYLIIRGHQIGGIHNSQIDEVWKEISKCKNCGASNFQMFLSKLDYFVAGEDYHVKVDPKFWSEVNSDDLHSPSSHIITYFVIIKCLKCGNRMFDEGLEFGDGGHSSEKEKDASPYKLIDNGEGREIVKRGIKKKLFSTDNGGCQKWLSLFIGYGLLIIVIFSIIWLFH
ncbi:MAG: hypothetical protein AB9897_04520 [Anaerolineaceae bacterium]